MSEIHLPPRIAQGQKVAIISPAGKVPFGHLDRAIETLESWGLHVLLGKHVYGKHDYLSGTDADRLADLQWAMDDPDVDFILCARGGYGTTRILDQINYNSILKQPKWIIGFSDITALHLKLNKLNIGSIHGPMGTSFRRIGAEKSISVLKSILFGDVAPVISSNKNSPWEKQGQATGQLVGGNLALLVDSLGTESELITDHKILFIEDIGEPVYKIDRMMTQLKRSGKLDKLAGLVVGDFTEVNGYDKGDEFTLEKVIHQEFRDFDYPLTYGFPIGHEPVNMPVISGGMYGLEVTGNKSLLTFINKSLPA